MTTRVEIEAPSPVAAADLQMRLRAEVGPATVYPAGEGRCDLVVETRSVRELVRQLGYWGSAFALANIQMKVNGRPYTLTVPETPAISESQGSAVETPSGSAADADDGSVAPPDAHAAGAPVVELVHRCAWCNRVLSEAGWQEAVPNALPQYETATICPSCVRRLRDAGLSW